MKTLINASILFMALNFQVRSICSLNPRLLRSVVHVLHTKGFLLASQSAKILNLGETLGAGTWNGHGTRMRKEHGMVKAHRISVPNIYNIALPPLVGLCYLLNLLLSYAKLRIHYFFLKRRLVY